MLLSVKLSVFSRQRMKTRSTGQQQGELAAQHQGFNIRGVNTDQRWFFLHCKLTTRFVLLYQNLSSCRSPDSGDTHSVTTGLTRTKRRDLGYKTPSQQAGVSKNPKANNRYHPTTLHLPRLFLSLPVCGHLLLLLTLPEGASLTPFSLSSRRGAPAADTMRPRAPCLLPRQLRCPRCVLLPAGSGTECLQLNLLTSKPVPCSPTVTPNRRSLVLPPHAEVHQAMCWVCTLKGIQRHQSAAARFVFQRELWQHAGASHTAQSRHLVICRDTMNCAHKTLGTSADSAPESEVFLPVLLC